MTLSGSNPEPVPFTITSPQSKMRPKIDCSASTLSTLFHMHLHRVAAAEALLVAWVPHRIAASLCKYFWTRSLIQRSRGRSGSLNTFVRNSAIIPEKRLPLSTCFLRSDTKIRHCLVARLNRVANREALTLASQAVTASPQGQRSRRRSLRAIGCCAFRCSQYQAICRSMSDSSIPGPNFAASRTNRWEPRACSSGTRSVRSRTGRTGT